MREHLLRKKSSELGGIQVPINLQLKQWTVEPGLWVPLTDENVIGIVRVKLTHKLAITLLVSDLEIELLLVEEVEAVHLVALVHDLAQVVNLGVAQDEV